MSKKRERKRSVDYGKIAGAVSGRSLAFMDPTIATRRKAEKRELERKANMATADMIGGIASGVATLGSAAEANLESWEEMETGLKSVGGESATLKSAGLDKGWLERAFTSAPAGGQMAITSEGVTKAFTGTELSQIGKAVKGGYQSTLFEPGSSLFESYGGTMEAAVGMTVENPYWNPKGGYSISEWGSSSPYRIQGTQTND